MLIYDKKAMTGFPIYFLVAIIISSLIISIFTISISEMIKKSKKDLLKNEIEKIIANAENMFEYADTGTVINLKTNFPDTLDFLVFGGIPESLNKKPSKFIFNEKTSNNYYYKLKDGTINCFSSHVRFCGKNSNELSILFKGENFLVLELVKEYNKTYVKIYPK